MGRDAWRLQNDLTSNDGLLNERQGHYNPSLLKGLEVVTTLNRRAQQPTPQSCLPVRSGNCTAVCAVLTGARFATGNTRLSFWMVFLVKVCKPGNGGLWSTEGCKTGQL